MEPRLHTSQAKKVVAAKVWETLRVKPCVTPAAESKVLPRVEGGGKEAVLEAKVPGGTCATAAQPANMAQAKGEVRGGVSGWAASPRKRPREQKDKDWWPLACTPPCQVCWRQAAGPPQTAAHGLTTSLDGTPGTLLL